MTTMDEFVIVAMLNQTSHSIMWVEGALSIARANCMDDKLIAMLSTVSSSLRDIQMNIKSYADDATPAKDAESDADSTTELRA